MLGCDVLFPCVSPRVTSPDNNEHNGSYTLIPGTLNDRFVEEFPPPSTGETQSTIGDLPPPHGETQHTVVLEDSGHLTNHTAGDTEVLFTITVGNHDPSETAQALPLPASEVQTTSLIPPTVQNVRDCDTFRDVSPFPVSPTAQPGMLRTHWLIAPSAGLVAGNNEADPSPPLTALFAHRGRTPTRSAPTADSKPRSLSADPELHSNRNWSGNTPGTPAFKPVACKWCYAALEWSGNGASTDCPTCVLTVWMRTRHVDPHYHLVDATRFYNTSSPTVVPPSTVECPLLPVPGDLERWGMVRYAPNDHDTVVIWAFDTPIGKLTARHAAYLRSVLLQQVWTRSQLYHVRVSEPYLMARLITWCANEAEYPLPPEPLFPFAGEGHIWPEHDTMPDLGVYRCATLPDIAGTLPPFHPATSAYAPIAEFASPINVAAYRSILVDHPRCDHIINNILFGASLLSDPPMYRRHTRFPDTFPKNKPVDTGLKDAVSVEFAIGAFKYWPRGLSTKYLRTCPAFGVLKPDGSTRLIGDLTRGPQSVNECTSRQGTDRMRLGNLARVFRRINYMFSIADGRAIRAIKLDATKAFKQLGIPVRDMHMAVHIVEGRFVLNMRLMMGAVASADNMAPFITAIGDYMSSEYGAFTDSYIDDQLLLTFQDGGQANADTLIHTWEWCGWGLQADKLEKWGRLSAIMEYLGVTIDLDNRRAYITESRCSKTRALLERWLAPQFHPTSRDYSKLAGKLQFISNVVPMGHAFSRSFFRFTTFAPHPLAVPATQPIDVLTDLTWWLHTLSSDETNAVYFGDEPVSPSFEVYTDASDFGMAAVCHERREFWAERFTRTEVSNSQIHHREGAAIAVAGFLWVPHASNGEIVNRSDSSACVTSFHSLRCRDFRLRMLMRLLAVLQTRSRTAIRFRHIPGEHNEAADHLSRHSDVPQALAHYTRLSIPPILRETLSIILSTWSHPTTWDEAGDLRLFERFNSIATLVQCTTPAILHWTPWNLQQIDPMQADDC